MSTAHTCRPRDSWGKAAKASACGDGEREGKGRGEEETAAEEEEATLGEAEGETAVGTVKTGPLPAMVTNGCWI